jgi:hypothetical protein
MPYLFTWYRQTILGTFTNILSELGFLDLWMIGYTKSQFRQSKLFNLALSLRIDILNKCLMKIMVVPK